MHNYIHTFLTFCLILPIFIAPAAIAADSSANETAKELMAVAEPAGLHPWNASVDLTWLPDSNIRDTGGRIGIEEVEAKFGRNFQFTPSLSLSAGIAYSLRNIDASAGARLPEALHRFSANLGGNYRIDKDIFLTLLVAPSLNGDFREIGTDDIRTRVGLMGRYNASAKLTLLAGIVYQQGYKSIPVIPIVGAIYRPDEKWTISLAAPRPGVAYSPNRTSSYYLGGEFAATEYQLHDPSLGAKIISYRDFRALAGAEYVLFSAVKVNFAGGYAFARRFVFHDGSRSDVDIDDGPFARVGVSLLW